MQYDFSKITHAIWYDLVLFRDSFKLHLNPKARCSTAGHFHDFSASTKMPTHAPQLSINKIVIKYLVTKKMFTYNRPRQTYVPYKNRLIIHHLPCIYLWTLGFFLAQKSSFENAEVSNLGSVQKLFELQFLLALPTVLPNFYGDHETIGPKEQKEMKLVGGEH